MKRHSTLTPRPAARQPQQCHLWSVGRECEQLAAHEGGGLLDPARRRCLPGGGQRQGAVQEVRQSQHRPQLRRRRLARVLGAPSRPRSLHCAAATIEQLRQNAR